MLRENSILPSKSTLTPTSSVSQRKSTTLTKPPTSLQETQAIINSEAHFVKSRSQLLTNLDGINTLLNDVLNIGISSSNSHAMSSDSGVFTTASSMSDSVTSNTSSSNNPISSRSLIYLPRIAVNRARTARRYASYDEKLNNPSSSPTIASIPSISTPIPYEKLKVFEIDERAFINQKPPEMSTVPANGSAITPDDAIAPDIVLAEIAASLTHLDKLKARIMDTKSKLLVTGDLNAGKSTFINAVLKRQVVPHDQQPCTAVFCEVVDADQNHGVEEVHGIHNIQAYRNHDSSSYHRFDLEQLQDLVENNTSNFSLLRAYVRDRRDAGESLLHNGLVDISLIDSPGLNIDQMKTMALFAQQEEIDVVVFMVNAENHFTLSAKEFLSSAGKEKAYVFIVVNRFDQIEKKDRCRRDVLDQIKKISPQTFEDADSLVHFVSAKQRLLPNPDPILLSDFDRLESRLRSFILEKRARSKLAPAKQYMINVLTDMYTFSSYTSFVLRNRVKHMSMELRSAEPGFMRMKDVKAKILDPLDTMIDTLAEQVQNNVALSLKTLVDSLTPENMDHLVPHLEYPGFFGAYAYGKELVRCVLGIANQQVRKCEARARSDALDKASAVYNSASVALSNLPPLDEDSIQQIFLEETSVASSISSKANTLVLESSDFFEPIAVSELVKEYVPGTIAVTLGAVGYAGMQWRIAHGLFRVGTSIGFANTVKIGFAAVTVSGLGYLIYMINALPKTIDRKIIRKLRAHFHHTSFVNMHSVRLGNAMRKSLRASLGRFKIQFLGIIQESENRQSGLVQLKNAFEEDASWWENIETKVVEMKKSVEAVVLDMIE